MISVQNLPLQSNGNKMSWQELFGIVVVKNVIIIKLCNSV